MSCDQVDHFSRYGVPDDDDDDEDDEDDDADMSPPPPTKDIPAEEEITVAPADEDDADMDGDDGDVTGGNSPPGESDWGVAAKRGKFHPQEGVEMRHPTTGPSGAPEKGVGNVAQKNDEGVAQFGNPSGPLQHSLPTLLGHRANDLMAMRDAFFGSSGAVAAESPLQLGEAGLRARQNAEMSGVAISGMTPSAFGRPLGQQVADFPGITPSGTALQLQQLPQHSWVRPRAPLLQSSKAVATTTAEADVAAAAGIVTTPSAGFRVQPGRGLGIPDVCHTPLCDASLVMGRAFRVGWGPNGVLVQPQNPERLLNPGRVSTACLTPPSPTVKLTHLSPVAAVAPPDKAAAIASHKPDNSVTVKQKSDAMRERAVAALRSHLKRSAAVAIIGNDVDDDTSSHTSVPRWALKCNRRQLASLVGEQLVGLGSGADVRHQRSTWRLVQVGAGS